MKSKQVRNLKSSDTVSLTGTDRHIVEYVFTVNGETTITFYDGSKLTLRSLVRLPVWSN